MIFTFKKYVSKSILKLYFFNINNESIVITLKWQTISCYKFNSGILAEKLKIPRKDHPYFQYSPYKKFVPCFHLTTVITAHRIKPKEIRRRYKMLKSPKLHMDCKRKARTTQSNFFTFLGLLWPRYIAHHSYILWMTSDSRLSFPART